MQVVVPVTSFRVWLKRLKSLEIARRLEVESLERWVGGRNRVFLEDLGCDAEVIENI